MYHVHGDMIPLTASPNVIMILKCSDPAGNVRMIRKKKSAVCGLSTEKKHS